MSNIYGTYITLPYAYGSLPGHPGYKETYEQSSKQSDQSYFTNIREDWMNGPTRSNFTACGGAGWNQGKPPCEACGGTDQVGSRMCNLCQPQSIIRPAAGAQPASWIPETYTINFGPKYNETKAIKK